MTRVATTQMGRPSSTVKNGFPIIQNGSNFEIKFKCLPEHQNIQILYTARFGPDEQLYALPQLQIPTASHAINL
jgi:hypothetical protein